MTVLAATESGGVDAGLLILRVAIGIVMFAHGYNHIFGGGRIKGTAGWFESLGMKPGLLHAWTASLAELGAGVLLVVGLATPLAAAAVVGTMLVALITNHLRNGYFIFRPGEGYEYVLTLILVAIAIGAVGAGGWSLDRAVGIGEDLVGWRGLAIAAGLGGGGGLALLAVFYRPPAR